MSDNIAHAVSGALGGIVAMASTYPLITISTRAQVERKKQHVPTHEAVLRIIQREGITGLYSGLNSALFGIAVTNGVYYYFYELTKAAFDKAASLKVPGGRPMTTVESMLAGAIAGSATCVISNPIWVTNTRMAAGTNDHEEKAAVAAPAPKKRIPGPPKKGPKAAAASAQKPKKMGTIATVAEILKEDGPLAFFRGLKPALVLVINPILQYTLFEQLKQRLEKTRVLKDWDFFLLGALSKLIATSITYPYIVLKARMQVSRQKAANHNVDDAHHYKNMIDGLQKIIKHEGGISALYKGIGSKLLQSVLTAAILFTYKEKFFRAAQTLLGQQKKA